MNAIIFNGYAVSRNSGLYASSRMLWQLAVDGHAPKFFAKLSRRGIPILCTYGNISCRLFSIFLASFFGDGVVYIWLLNASGMSGFIAWLGIALGSLSFPPSVLMHHKA